MMLVVSLVIALFFLLSFFWATKTGQYDDDYSPSVRILFDDELIDNKVEKQTQIENQNQVKNGSRKV